MSARRSLTLRLRTAKMSGSAIEPRERLSANPSDAVVSFLLEAHADSDGGFPFPPAQQEHVGMDQTKLEEAKKYAQTGGGSGCIIRGGRLVMKWGNQKRKYNNREFENSSDDGQLTTTSHLQRDNGDQRQD